MKLSYKQLRVFADNSVKIEHEGETTHFYIRKDDIWVDLSIDDNIKMMLKIEGLPQEKFAITIYDLEADIINMNIYGSFELPDSPSLLDALKKYPVKESIYKD